MPIKNTPFNRAVAAGNESQVKISEKQSIKFMSSLFAVVMVLFSGEAAAHFDVTFADVAKSYSNCSYAETDTVATFNLTISYNHGGKSFYSRGVMLYVYNESGQIKAPPTDIVSSVSLNGTAYDKASIMDDFVFYYGNVGVVPNATWNMKDPITANIKITVLKSKIASWPAIGVRAGNFLYGNDFVGELSGLAYIGPSTTGGNCSVITSPELPPPAVTPKVTMSAPDWDLGELPRGKETALALPEAKDQLCFSYENSTVLTNQKYLINATNTNGVSTNDHYLLKSLEDSSQTVPYTLTLANSKDSVLLPNTQNRLVSLETGGKTCFTPTFKAEPDKAVKDGAYSDILTFTVVAKA